MNTRRWVWSQARSGSPVAEKHDWRLRGAAKVTRTEQPNGRLDFDDKEYSSGPDEEM